MEDDQRVAIQRWLDTVTWEFNPSGYRQCECSLFFRPYGHRFRCRECVERCPHNGSHLLGHVTAVNGAKAPHKLCLMCGHLVTLRKGTGPGEFCFKDNRRDLDVQPCARCSSTTGTELHHWAPRAVFGFNEADRWPQSYLCVSCHNIWHQEMRKARGVSLPREQRIDDLGPLEQLGESA